MMEVNSLKITHAEILRINSFIEGEDGSRNPWRPIICKLYTDEGIYGIGEAALAYGKANNAGVGILKDYIPLVIGMDPFDTEAIWDKLMHKTFWGQGGGTVVFAGMSAIDMACWDIKGKALKQPLYNLIGGKCREKLRCYASQIQFGFEPIKKPCTRPEQYADAVRYCIEQGFSAVKVDLMEFDRNARFKALDLHGVLNHDIIQMAEERIAAIREAAGDSVEVIVENHAETDAISSIQVANVIRNYDIMFYEETNTPLNAKLAAQLKQKIGIPLAGGERIYSRWGYVPFIEQRSLDIIQPDLGTCGGVSEAKKICAMACLYDIGVQTHICGSPVVNAASLHLEASIPNFVIHEHHRHAIMKSNVDLCIYDYQPIDGYYSIPDRPGLGQDLSDYAYSIADVISIN